MQAPNRLYQSEVRGSVSRVETPRVLDVLTALSDCRHETVEKIMERRISGVSYMCWIDFHNGIWGCGLLCTLLISFYFTANTPRATTPHLYITGSHAEGYHAPSIPHGPPRLYHHCTAITSVYIPAITPRATTPHTYHHGPSRLCIHPGYHTRAITLHNTRTSGYHTRY